VDTTEKFHICKETGRKNSWMTNIQLHPIEYFKQYYRMIKKTLCTWWLQLKNTQKYFKQFQTLTVITQLELGKTDGVSVSLVSINAWRLAGDSLNITYNFLYCNNQVHRDVLITLYKKVVWLVSVHCSATLPLHCSRQLTATDRPSDCPHNLTLHEGTSNYEAVTVCHIQEHVST
jgi:hypothetical protein